MDKSLWLTFLAHPVYIVDTSLLKLPNDSATMMLVTSIVVDNLGFWVIQIRISQHENHDICVV